MRRANPERAPDDPRTVAAGRGAMSRRGRNVALGAVTVLVLLAVAPGAWALCDDDTDEVFWNEFEVCKIYDGTKDFVEQCGDSDRAAEARECLERWDAEAAEWERVGCTDNAQVERFIETHPNGRLIESARECLARLKEAERAPGRQFRDCDTCPLMVVVRRGSYKMGPSSTWSDDLRDVTISEPFAVGVYEVTFREWDACHQAGRCKHRPGDNGWGRKTLPVINVSWDDAQEYVKWLSDKTRAKYRLPSESEWEYVARAGTKTAYHFGHQISRDDANFGRFVIRPVPVGSYESNEFGLHDVHGNVWEWVEDCWHRDYWGAPLDGSAWVTGDDCDYRIMRGGSWFNGEWHARSAHRGEKPTRYRTLTVGFRVARTLD